MKRYQSDIQIPALGTLIDVEFCARHVTLFGVKTGNSHAIGLIDGHQIMVEKFLNENEEEEEREVLVMESFEDAVYRVFGATLKEIG